MSPALALLLALPAPVPPAPVPPAQLIDAAAACFEVVDYDCAEERLAGAWRAGGLEPADELRGRLLEAQIALARRDEPAARRALQTVFALKPDYSPDRRLPARLRALADELRPPPPPFLRGLARADVTSWRLFGQDGDRWSDGLGFDVAAGALFVDRFELGAGYFYSDHRPLTYELSGLVVRGGYLSGGVRLPAAFLVFTPGLSLGAVRVNADGVTGSDAYWGFRAELPLDVTAELWHGLGLGARLGLDMLVVQDGDRAAFSWILPLQAGIRGVF